ncbi:MAG: hypothetical protein JWQ49_2376 [Edaphobacter sp.]|nr:hypothetical protein [Edaphobacter sp.]
MDYKTFPAFRSNISCNRMNWLDCLLSIAPRSEHSHCPNVYVGGRKLCERPHLANI